MTKNPFLITKAEGFNHSYDQLALLMQFKTNVADVLLSNSNVFVEGSRGSGKSMYLKLLSFPVKAKYEKLVKQKKADQLPKHKEYLGVYVKLTPTIFGAHEYETQPGFKEIFQQLFNVYCTENLINTIIEADQDDAIHLDALDKNTLLKEIPKLILPEHSSFQDLSHLAKALSEERKRIKQAINSLPFSSDERSQPETLWEIANIVSKIKPFIGQRVHLLVDEYDSLSENQQRILNMYLRKRDFPITFKIACRKHRLTYLDIEGRPLNPSGDFDRVELDDDDFGSSGKFKKYLEEIANKRLKSVGISKDIKTLLGKKPLPTKQKAEKKYGGFDLIAILSSGIVRTFMELCRDMFSSAKMDGNNSPLPFEVDVQDRVIKEHAANKWNALSRDQSAKPDLQHMVDQIGTVFKKKSESGAEKQIIRLELVDYNKASSFVRGLLNKALEFEALVQPNRQRLQKNSFSISRGFLLNRLLCVHFRLSPSSRWDFEITPDQLEALILGDKKSIDDLLKNPKKYSYSTYNETAGNLFESRHCPILDQKCPDFNPKKGLGFLSCRLPEKGIIKDAMNLFKEQFSKIDGQFQYELKTALDYPPEGDIACKVCSALSISDFVLVELSKLSPSVAMELGLSIARNLPTYILFNKEEQPNVPEPFSSLEYISYSITPESIKRVVNDRIYPFLTGPPENRGQIKLGPRPDKAFDEGNGVFISLPETDYYQNTVLPELKNLLKVIGPVTTENDGHALQDLERAAIGIASSKFSIIDTTNSSTTRAMYLGMAQGYRKPFVNLISKASDSSLKVFTNARSKSEIEYSDTDDLLEKVRNFFTRFQINL